MISLFRRKDYRREVDSETKDRRHYQIIGKNSILYDYLALAPAFFGALLGMHYSLDNQNPILGLESLFIGMGITSMILAYKFRQYTKLEDKLEDI